MNEAVGKRDAAYITEDAKKQAIAGASYIDVNAGSRIGTEMDDLNWRVEVVEGAADVPLSLVIWIPLKRKAMAARSSSL
ncbi:MAG: hypothetical protein NTY64_14095 [Deltaproteobacteria bacterium]|nr:hypothetical protein [Deltaproteobacteria bacterium]